MVPWSHWRHPFLGRLLTDWTSEFTHFNLVIRLSLSNVKQSAIPLFRTSAFFVKSRCSGRPLRIFEICTPYLWSRTEPPQTPFSPLFISGEVNLCALNSSNLNSRLCPCGLTWPRSRLGVTHDSLGLGVNWGPLIVVVFSVSPTSPAFGPLFHAFFLP